MPFENTFHLFAIHRFGFSCREIPRVHQEHQPSKDEIVRMVPIRTLRFSLYRLQRFVIVVIALLFVLEQLN
jgi:hypothetical protein